MDIIAKIRENLSPHLATLGEIEKTADQDAGAGLDSLAKFIASLIRDGAASSELREILARLDRIEHNQEKQMTALENLQAQDAALAAEVTTVIADWQAALANAGAANDPAIQAVADDMGAKIALLQGADPASVVSAPPADGSGGSATPSA